MIVYPDIPVKRQRDLTNALYKISLFRKQPPAIRVDAFHWVYWQWVKCKEWHGSLLTIPLLLRCSDLPDLHAFFWNSWDWELVLLSAKICAIFSFSDWDHSEIWPHPGQVWQVVATQNECCPVWNRATGLWQVTLQPAPLLTALQSGRI